MEFRWIALLALWTLLSGPMLVHPVRSARSVTTDLLPARKAQPTKDGKAPRPASPPAPKGSEKALRTIVRPFP